MKRKCDLPVIAESATHPKKARPKGSIGIENQLYKKRDSEGAGFISCEKDDIGSIPESHFGRFSRAGGDFTGRLESATLVRASNLFMVQNFADIQKTEEANQKDSTNLDSNISKLENLVLRLLPGSDFAKTIRAMGNWTAGPILFAPLDGEELHTLLCVLKAPLAKTFQLEPGSEILIAGRANNLETLRKFITAVNAIHDGTDHPSPSLLRKNLDLVAEMQKSYAPSQAPHADMAVLLESMFVSVWEKNGLTIFERTRDWVAFLISVFIFARPGEISTNCILAESIRVVHIGPGPGNGTAIPDAIAFKLHQWKLHPLSKGPIEFLAHMNCVDPRFCVVAWLLQWMSISGITRGPIFPRIVAGTEVVPAHHTREVRGVMTTFTSSDESECTNMDVSYWSLRIKQHLEHAGFPQCTAYSIRRSACMWAGRCKGEPWAVQATGRWKDMSEVSTYMAEGVTLVTQLYNDEASKDPIRKLWVYKANVMAAIATRVGP